MIQQGNDKKMNHHPSQMGPTQGRIVYSYCFLSNLLMFRPVSIQTQTGFWFRDFYGNLVGLQRTVRTLGHTIYGSPTQCMSISRYICSSSLRQLEPGLLNCIYLVLKNIY